MWLQVQDQQGGVCSLTDRNARLDAHEIRGCGTKPKTRGRFEPETVTDAMREQRRSARLHQGPAGLSVVACVCCGADDSEEENLELDLGQVGTHAFARMEADVDKQRKQVLQGQMSEAAAQKQHQRKYAATTSLYPSSPYPVAQATETLLL